MLIIVDSEEEKQNLISESRYIHDFVKNVRIRTKNGKAKNVLVGLDSDFCNTMMHIYQDPDCIKVEVKGI